MGDDDYDEYSKELHQYKKSKDRGRGSCTFHFIFTSLKSTLKQLCFCQKSIRPQSFIPQGPKEAVDEVEVKGGGA